MRLVIAGIVGGAVCIASASCATQTIAAIFDHQSALGAPIVRTRDGAFYWPWRILEWNRRWAEDYPRPFAVARALMLAGVCLAGAAAAVVRKPPRRIKPFARGAWARRADVAAAGLFAAQGVVLGKFENEILCYDGPEHQLLIGASRSGKGRGHVVPTLLAWPGSALVLDVKGELADGDARVAFPGVASFRGALGPVLRFAPTRLESASFNPLFEVRRGANEVRDVQNIVEILVDPAGDQRHQDFWDRSAKQILVGVILHVLYAEPLARKTLAVVREKLRDLEATCAAMKATLHRLSPVTGAPEVHPEALHAAESFLAGEARLQSGVKATAEAYKFLTPSAAAQLTEIARQDDPFLSLGRVGRTVHVHSVLARSDRSWEVSWTERAANETGRGDGEAFTGVFTVTTRAPKTADEIATNPLGLLISDFSWSRVR